MNPEPRLTTSQPSDRDLFRQLPQPMLVLAMEDSAILDANPVAAAMYRCQVADLTGLLVEPADNAGEATGASRQTPPGASIFFGKSRLPDSRWIQIAGDGYDVLYAGQPARVIVLHDRAPAAESHPVDGEFQLRRILAGIDEGLLVVDGEGTVRFANPSASQLLGRSSAQLEGNRLPLPLDLCDGDELDLRLPGRAVRTVEARIGTTTWSGEQARIYTLRDISARRATENRMRLLERAIESSKSAVVISDALRPDHPVLYVNPAFERITGYSRQEVIGRNCRFLQNDDSDQPELATIRAAMGNNDDCEVLLRNYRKDGTLFWNQLSISPVRNDSGTVTNYLAVQTDVSERRGYEAELAHHANHDAVTGLPCYRVFEEYTRIMIAEAERTGGRVAMLYINMDRFHTINETMGHHVGDRALKLIGERLEANIGDGGKVCRVSSDEFACVIPHYHGELDPEDFAVQLQRRMEAALPILPYRLYLTCCVGIASHPEVAASPAQLLHFSQAAMNRAKRTGRNSCLTFSSDHVLQMRDRLLLGSRFRDAILNDELVLHYQPQISAHSGRITGVEALVRWQTKDMGLLMPMRFIQVAEDLGLIVDLGRWVLEAACRQAREWQLAGHDDISMAVNVSTLQLQRPSFITEVDDILKSTGLAPRMLEIELTESAIMENIDSMGETILALKRLGVRLALDDFGVGYSSLNYLRRFPIDKLKIDRSFIQDISNNAGEAAIARAIIAMGHQLQMTVIAEGVENESQVGYLRRNHCDEFQGYLFEKPMPAAEATAILGRRFIMPATLKDADRERTLLLVDDEENVLRSLVRLFRRDGYLLLTANSAQEALDILARNDVQVILSDQRMPEINGTEFLSTVKELYPETLRLVLSGCTDSGTITDAINRGAIYKFLAKPWDEAELRQQILDAFRATENRGDANRAA